MDIVYNMTMKVSVYENHEHSWPSKYEFKKPVVRSRVTWTYVAST